MSKRRRKKRLIDTSDLAPKIAEGLTQDVSLKEALEAHPIRSSSGVERLRNFENRATILPGRRLPVPSFVGESSVSSDFYTEFADGRRFQDVTKRFTPEVNEAILQGLICMRCLEPQNFPFEDEHLEGCEGTAIHGPHYMRDRQLIEYAAEFEGPKHLGPVKPMTQFLDAQDERVEKRQFIRRVLSGGQGAVPKEWLKDNELMDGLTPSEIRRIS